MAKAMLLACTLLTTAPAWAQAPASSRGNTEPATSTGAGVRFTDRPFQLELRTGFATSVGELGYVAEYNPFDRVAIGGGFGMNTLGAEYGAHVRLRPLVATATRRLHAFTIETAISRSRYANFMGDLNDQLSLCGLDSNDVCNKDVTPQWVTWMQFELGWETRSANGFSVRVSSGFAFALNSPNWQCTDGGSAVACGKVTTTLPSLSVALGYAF